MLLKLTKCTLINFLKSDNSISSIIHWWLTTLLTLSRKCSLFFRWTSFVKCSVAGFGSLFSSSRMSNIPDPFPSIRSAQIKTTKKLKTVYIALNAKPSIHLRAIKRQLPYGIPATWQWMRQRGQYLIYIQIRMQGWVYPRSIVYIHRWLILAVADHVKSLSQLFLRSWDPHGNTDGHSARH